MSLVSRDPYARQELHKQIASVMNGKTCDWCGSVRWSRHKTPVPQLYSFTTETDGGRSFRDKGLFCSRSCRDDYHCG